MIVDLSASGKVDVLRQMLKRYNSGSRREKEQFLIIRAGILSKPGALFVLRDLIPLL